MKKVSAILTTVLLTTILWAQSPEKMSYQAVVRSTNDQLVINQQIGMQISILQGSAIGTAVYVETQTPTTNSNGLFSIEIGGGTGFDTINWANGPYFIKTETDPTGGTSYTISGISQLLSVPYALHAKTAESIVDTSKHYVGELYGGGIVYYVDETGEHGLIASLDDIDGGSGVAWSNTIDVEIGDSAKSLSNGVNNTVAIVAQDNTSGFAATLCYSYSGGGFTDWYLPSNRELYLLCSQDILICKILNNDSDELTNGFNLYSAPVKPYYWSSTEQDFDSAWIYNFETGHLSGSWKPGIWLVRAVRAF